jgi:hypothetical protein
MNVFGAIAALQSGRPDERVVLTQAITCLNHSNTPNCCYTDYWLDTIGGRAYVPIVIKVLVAIRPIRAGEELTISYGEGWHDEPFTLGEHSVDTALVCAGLARAQASARRYICDYLHSAAFLAMLEQHLRLFDEYASEIRLRRDGCVTGSSLSGMLATALQRVRAFWADPSVLVSIQSAQYRAPEDTKMYTNDPIPAYAEVDADYSSGDSSGRCVDDR